ncbi:MAG: SufS family cysteine desulfurase [Actinobacteria bacterium]|uniref:cysteine desulfurase n=1 Tax=freshwater metagenome TaxID=449393 RepID=A0A6J6VS45_9ZZZZ|nr:SufS family cysteine desulfurase [Actinomycetota bacterium]
MSIDLAAIRSEFPLLKRQINGKRLVYVDSAATSQKPQSVLDAMDNYYTTQNANVHRGVYTLAEEATSAFESARARTAKFIGAQDPHELVFTRNATESINLVARTWGYQNLRDGDVVVLTEMEHHANIVPWQMLSAERGIVIRWIPITADYRLDLSDIDALLDGASLLAVTSMSNVLGTVNDIEKLVAAARSAGAKVLVDACQSIPHDPVDVVAWGADFVAFSGHKMMGPTGIGALWARRELLEEMPPFLGGGEMIRDVRKDGFTTNDVPWKFEAGTPAIAEAIGLGAAVDWLSAVGMENIASHERALTAYALEQLTSAFGDEITIYGPPTAEGRGSAVSFLFNEIHAHDISQVLDEDGVCVRAGHHCAKPLMRVLGVPATSRASFAIYNTFEDIDALVEALHKAKTFFAR